MVGGSWPFVVSSLSPHFCWGADGTATQLASIIGPIAIACPFVSSPPRLPLLCPPSVILTDHNSNVYVPPSRAAITKARLPGSLPTRGIHRVRGASQHACRRKTTEIMQPSLELSSSSSVRPRWPDPRPLTPRPRSTNWLMFASRPVPVPAALPCTCRPMYALSFRN